MLAWKKIPYKKTLIVMIPKVNSRIGNIEAWIINVQWCAERFVSDILSLVPRTTIVGGLDTMFILQVFCYDKQKQLHKVASVQQSICTLALV